MKPKARKIVTPEQKEKEQPNTAAIVTTKATVWDALDKVTKELSPANTRSVQEHVHGIQSDLKVMHERKDSIASRLAAIHTLLGKEGFASFSENVMPRFGVSKSTVYRWLESGQLVRDAIPELYLRQALVGRLDKPLTTTDTKTGEVKLLPAFEKALKDVPMPAKHDDGKGNQVYTPETIDAWTAAIDKKTRELGKKKPKSKAQLKKDRAERITDLFTTYLAEYGTQDAESLLNVLDQLHTQAAKTIESTATPINTAKQANA